MSDLPMFTGWRFEPSQMLWQRWWNGMLIETMTARFMASIMRTCRHV